MKLTNNEIRQEADRGKNQRKYFEIENVVKRKPGGLNIRKSSAGVNLCIYPTMKSCNSQT